MAKIDWTVGTVAGEIAELKADVLHIEGLERDAVNAHLAHLVAAWEADGGCTRCNGEGRYNYNPYSWSNGWPEYEYCDCPTPRTKRPTEDDARKDPAFPGDLVSQLVARREALRAAEEANQFKVGDVVRVISGRAVPPGFSGTVEYVDRDTGKAKVMSRYGAVKWVAANHLSVVRMDEEALAVIRAEREARIENAKMERAVKTDAVNEANRLPDLLGSEKQVRWALDIRADFVSAHPGSAEALDLARKVVLAKWWVDVRGSIRKLEEMARMPLPSDADVRWAKKKYATR